MVALTFDAGGPVEPAVRVLDTLRDHSVHATFFLSGQWIEAHPEMAPVVNGSPPFSRPVLMHGTVVDSHVSQIDFPSNHIYFDQNTDIALDAADEGFLATGNFFPENLAGGKPVLELEWETGSYPAWAWAGVGDRMVVLGRWIFDCGRPSPIPGHGAASGKPCLTTFDLPAGDHCPALCNLD